jgi:hypothetical protein
MHFCTRAHCQCENHFDGDAMAGQKDVDLIDIDFLDAWNNDIDNFTLSQICETLENENLAFKGICDLSLSLKEEDLGMILGMIMALLM